MLLDILTYKSQHLHRNQLKEKKKKKEATTQHEQPIVLFSS